MKWAQSNTVRVVAEVGESYNDVFVCEFEPDLPLLAFADAKENGQACYRKLDLMPTTRFAKNLQIQSLWFLGNTVCRGECLLAYGWRIIWFK